MKSSDPDDKNARLLALARLRQATRWPGYKSIADYHHGVYECDFVSPYTKTAGNVDAEVMVLLQDWMRMTKDCPSLASVRMKPDTTTTLSL